MTVTVELSLLITVGSLLVGLIAWLVGLQWRQRGHEKECALRYKGIQEAADDVRQYSKEAAQTVKRAFDERHALDQKARDERHQENVDRFHAIERHLEKQDDKLDRLLRPQPGVHELIQTMQVVMQEMADRQQREPVPPTKRLEP